MPSLARRPVLRLGGAALVAGLAARAGHTAPIDPLARIDPELREGARQVMAMTAKLGPMGPATVAAMREGGQHMLPAPLPDVPFREQRIAVSAAIPDVAVLVINHRSGPARPAILHTHGGGFVVGSARGELPRLQAIARDLDCVIVSVDYTLAPEARFARSIAENYAGLRWLHANAEALGVDRARIAVMGESAGGGHAALLAIRARGQIPLAAQILIYPMLDDRTGSILQPPPGIGLIGWDSPANRYGWQAFLGMAPATRGVPREAVPARTRDVAGLAPAFIAVGGADLFVDEDITWARRLTDAGVATQLLVIPGAFHGFDAVVPGAAASRLFTAAKMNALRRAFALPLTGIGG